MMNRLALFLASVAAAAVLVVAFAAAGFAPPAPSAALSSTDVTAAPPLADAVAAADPATPEPTTQVDTVYVEPAPTPGTIRIVKPAPTLAPVVVRRLVTAASAGEDDHEGAGEDD